MSKTSKTETNGMALAVAFKRMLAQPAMWVPLKLAKQSILNMRVRMNKGDHPSLDLMHDWLGRAGWKCIVEEVWAPGPKWKPLPPVGRGRPRKVAPVKAKASKPKAKAKGKGKGKKGRKRK